MKFVVKQSEALSYQKCTLATKSLEMVTISQGGDHREFLNWRNVSKTESPTSKVQKMHTKMQQLLLNAQFNPTHNGCLGQKSFVKLLASSFSPMKRLGRENFHMYFQ